MLKYAGCDGLNLSKDENTLNTDVKHRRMSGARMLKNGVMSSKNESWLRNTKEGRSHKGYVFYSVRIFK